MVIGNVDILALLSTYRGRINRAKYWIAVLCYLIIGVALTVLGIMLGILGSLGGYLMILVAVVVYVAMIVSGIFVGIKRLHDRGKTGWWLLVFMLAPAILSALGFAIGGFLATLCSLASLGISIWMFVELGCLAGTPGANQYGPDPLAATAAATA